MPLHKPEQEPIKPIEEKKQEIVNDSDFKTWLITLYSTQYDQHDLELLYEQVRYKGFDRLVVLKKLFEKFKDQRLVCQIIIVCAVQGPQRASVTKLLNGQTLLDMGIPASGQKGTENISCSRIISSTADLAAHYLKRLDVPKRLPTHECPAWLQFPSAGSIKLPSRLRELHMDYAIKFSKVIGGLFNEGIYSQMMANAYLDENLKLFD